MFERRPCVDDLADHVPLITEAMKWDAELEKSKVSSVFWSELRQWTRFRDVLATCYSSLEVRVACRCFHLDF